MPLLGGFGTFTATGVGCFNSAHIVATHPALTGLTDSTLSNWSCSVHEAFDSWPLSFEVLAIAQGIGTVFTTVVQMVAAGQGCTLLPAIAARVEARPESGIVVRSLAAPAPSRQITLVWRKRSPRVDHYRELAALLRPLLTPA